MTQAHEGSSMFERLAAQRDNSPLLLALRRRWWVIALIACVSGLAAYIFSGRQQKQYTATSALLFISQPLDQELVGSTIINNVDPNRQAATNQALVQLPTVSAIVGRDLHVPAADVASEVSFGSDAQSDVLDINVTDASPTMAARIANSYVRDYINFRVQASVQQINTTENAIDAKLAAIPLTARGGPIAQHLLADRTQLELLKSAQTGDAQVVLRATPPRSPSSPKPKRDGMLGFVLGALVGTLLIVVLERRDRRIKTIDEVEEVYRAPVIGMIPESSALRTGGVGAPRDEEAFMMIRAQLRYTSTDRTVRRIMVTSAQSGEGKTLVSLNLARAAALAEGIRTLLIETDTRRPSLSKLIGRGSVAGLAQLLSYDHDLESGLRELVVTPEATTEWERAGRLDVLLAGMNPPNPVKLLASKRMRDLLDSADSLYDMVIIDTPPIGVVSDAIPLLRFVDGIVLISRLGTSRRDPGARLAKRLRGLGAEILGVVVNGVKPSGDPYYGRYEPYLDEPSVSRRLLTRQKTRR